MNSDGPVHLDPLPATPTDRRSAVAGVVLVTRSAGQEAELTSYEAAQSDPSVPVKAECLEFQPDVISAIQIALIRAYDRQAVRKIAEAIDPARVVDGADGSLWLLAEQEPGAEPRGWPLWW